jgi:hypothetical protein
VCVFTTAARIKKGMIADRGRSGTDHNPLSLDDDNGDQDTGRRYGGRTGLQHLEMGISGSSISEVVETPRTAAMAVNDVEITDAQGQRIFELRSLIRRAFFWSILSICSVGTVVCWPFDLIMVIAVYMVVSEATSTNNRHTILNSSQYGFCGIRHVYGLCIASIVFCVAFGMGRLAYTFTHWMGPEYLKGPVPSVQSYQDWSTQVTVSLAIQVVATIGSGVTIYYLLLIMSLVAPEKNSQCMYPAARILADPKYVAPPGWPISTCWKFMLCVILLPTLIVAMFLIAEAATYAKPVNYCKHLAYSFKDPYYAPSSISPCCGLLTGSVLSCSLVIANSTTSTGAVASSVKYPSNNITYFNKSPRECDCVSPESASKQSLGPPVGDVCSATVSGPSSRCIQSSNLGCPQTFTAFIPFTKLSLSFAQVVQEFFRAHMRREVPTCVTTDACSNAFLTMTRYFAARPDSESYNVITCPSSSYTCQLSPPSSKTDQYCQYYVHYTWFPSDESWVWVNSTNKRT